MTRKKTATRRDAGRARGAPIAEAVLRSTLEDLATFGLEGLSVESVARRAEVNKTSIYRRWPTREALIVAALEGVLENMTAQVPDTGSLRGDLLGLVTPVADLMNQPMGRSLVRAALAETTESGVAALVARQLEKQTTSPGSMLVARATQRGEWREGVSAEQLLFVIIGAMLHRAMMEHATIDEAWLSSTLDLVLYGVLPRDAKRG